MNKFLRADEKILWEGRAKNFSLTEAPYNTTLMVRWIIWGIIAVGLSAGYFAYAAMDSVVEFQPILLLFTIGVPLFFGLQPVFDRKAILGKSVYAITNYRAICFVHDREIWSLPLEKAERFRIDKLGNGTGVVFMGSASTAKASAARVLSLLGQQDRDGVNTTGIVFYAVEDYETVRKLLVGGAKAK